MRLNRKQHTFTQMLALGTVFGLALTAAALWGSPLTRASAPHTYPPTFGIVGITHGQTARLNVVNTMDIFNPRGIPPRPTRVRLTFLDGNGRVVAETTRTIEPGQAASLEVNADRFFPPGPSRLQLRPVVTVDNLDLVDNPDIYEFVPCVMPTVEVYGNETGVTSLVVPATLRRFTNLPDPYGAP